MRQKRAKTYRKLMSSYCMHFGFRQPYQVLVDSEICKEALSSKMDLPKQLSVVLQGSVKPMITQCCIHELYLQGRTQQPAVDLAKTFERRKCNHREPIPGEECLTSVVGESNKHRYVIASQSQPLRSKLRQIPAVPLVHINRSVVVLEPPSDKTVHIKEIAEQQGLLPSALEKAQLSTIAPGPSEPPKKKNKGPKGPNPLSVKKKKVKTDAQPAPKKDKGKGKEKEKATLKPVGDAQGVKAGAKREREDDGGGETGVVQGEDSNANLDSEGVHKTKRRRKKGSSAASSANDTS